jgi:hypothetical protein
MSKHNNPIAIPIECFKKIEKESRSDIFRPEYLSVWQIPVFRYSLLMRNRGYIEFETFEKQC